MKGQVLSKCVLLGLVFLVSGVLFTITGCGGGGGGGDGGGGNTGGVAEVNDISLHGKSQDDVVIVAARKDTAEVASSAASKFPSLNFTFLGSEKPFKFYLVQNNTRAFPFYQGNTNVFNLAPQDISIDVGFISSVSGVAQAENNLLAITGISSGGEDTSVPSSLTSLAFSQADLTGEWHNFNLVSTDGTAGQQAGWAHSKWTADGNGLVVQSSVLDSLGNTIAADFDLFAGVSGLTATPDEATYRGFVGLDRSSLIGVGTLKPTGNPGPQGFCLQTAVKRGAGYATADLLGSWYFFGLVTGTTGAGQRPGWYWGKKDINVAGNISFPIPVTDSLGSSFTPPLGTVYTVAVDGSITATGNATFHGAINQGKNLFLATYTGSPAGAAGVTGYNLQFNVKAGSGFATSDLKGTWLFDMIGAGAGGFTGWARGEIVFNESGATIWRSVVRSNGTSQATSASDFSTAIDANGFITSATDSTLHGIMSGDRKLIIITRQDTGGDAMLMILRK